MGSFGRRPFSRSAFLVSAFLVSAFLVSAIACGASDAELCTMDDDCPAFHRCIAEQCRPLSTSDAGPRADSGTITRRDGGSSDADRPDGAMPVGTGRVSVLSAVDPTGMFGWFAFAEFIPATRSDCTIDRDEWCVYRDCPADEAFPHAGPIALASKGSSGGTMLPNKTGLYVSSGSSSLWGSGDLFSLTATGAEVPAFDVVLTPPATADVREGELGGVPIRDAILMRFFPAGGGTSIIVDAMLPTVFILRDLTIAAVREVRCDFPVGTGRMDIPFVDQLRPAPTALVAVATVESEVRVVGGWTVIVEALQAAEFEGIPVAAVVRLD